MGSFIRGPSSDHIFRTASGYMSKFFSRGWGDPEIYHQLSKLQSLFRKKSYVVNNAYKVFENTKINITKVNSGDKNLNIYKGDFISPLKHYIPRSLPVESEKAHFQIILPKQWKGKEKPVCVHLAGTGDHRFWRRRQFMAVPLAKEENIGSIILENPFYGFRKPKHQVRSAVHHVSDIFVMGAALLTEVVTLLLWCQRNNYGPLGVTGISMGGHMATVASSGWFEPLAIVPCLSWSSAAPAFTEGVLSRSVHWDVLEKQLHEDKRYKEILRNDSEFQELLKTHYCSEQSINTTQTPNIQQNISYSELNEVKNVDIDDNDNSKYNQIYNKFSSLLSNLQLSSYMDLRGKKIGPYALEIDLWKYLESFPKHLYSSTFSKVNLDYLRELSWLYDNKEKHPSPETVAFMTGVMDINTHLSHFNQPHRDSVVTYVVAEHDKYIPREYYHVTPQDIWKQTEVRTIDCGHVIAALQHQKDFRIAIKDSLEKLMLF